MRDAQHGVRGEADRPPIEPGRDAIDLGKERRERGRGVGHRVDAVVERAVEQGAAPSPRCMMHPVGDRVGERIALQQGVLEAVHPGIVAAQARAEGAQREVGQGEERPLAGGAPARRDAGVDRHRASLHYEA
jgi:hypothetical protein